MKQAKVAQSRSEWVKAGQNGSKWVKTGQSFYKTGSKWVKAGQNLTSLAQAVQIGIFFVCVVHVIFEVL